RPPTPSPFPYTTLFRSFRHMGTSSHGAARTALSFTDQREDVAVRVLEPCRFHAAAGMVHVALPGRSGQVVVVLEDHPLALEGFQDRKSTRLNSSHGSIS